MYNLQILRQFPFIYRWRSALLWRAFFTTAMVAVVLRALIDFCKSGRCGLFGKGGLIMFDVTADYVTYHLVDLPPVITLGVLGGILGSLYNFFLDKVLRLYNFINEYVLCTDVTSSLNNPYLHSLNCTYSILLIFQYQKYVICTVILDHLWKQITVNVQRTPNIHPLNHV